MHPTGERTIPEVATRTKPSCWDESSSLQTTVRGKGMDFDILKKRCVNYFVKGGEMILVLLLLRFCCSTPAAKHLRNVAKAMCAFILCEVH